MSDTDDTDALLTCDPGGGLNSLLGRTIDEVSSQMESGSSTVKKPVELAVTKGVEGTPSVGNKSKHKRSLRKSVDTTLDVSDYFNSEGELVLSGISQSSDTSQDGSSLSGDMKGTSSGENADYSSDQSTTSTEESNTVVPLSTKSRDTKDGRENQKKDVGQKIRNDDKLCHSSYNKLQLDKSQPIPKDIQSELKRQLFQANSSNPEAQSILENNSAHISYGVLNLNLNDLKTFAEGLSLCNIFPLSPKVNTYVPTSNAKGEQVFVRAPNFRTPGGYKPPTNPRKCRDLTDEQIQEEVRKMYAFPDVDDDSNVEIQKCDKKKTDSESTPTCSENKASEEKVKVDFNFLDGKPVPSEFGKGKSGKPIKRKMLPNGGNICGGTIGSIPDLGFGLRNRSEKISEPLVEKSAAWITGGELHEMKDKDRANPLFNGDHGKFSFGFGEEFVFSPIKPSVAPTNHSNASNLFDSQRMQPSPDTILSTVESLKPHSSAATTEPGRVNDDIKLAEPTAGTSQTCVIRGSRNKPSTPKRRLIKKAASKHRAMTSSKSEDAGGSIADHSSAPATGCIASDLEKILSEIDIPSEELESLLENFDESDSHGPATFFENIDAVDGSLADALCNLKLDGWKNTDSKFSEKYHDEQIKREQCEKELRKLQESFLAEKQQNAVLEGTLKRRNVMLMQITVAFNRVCKEWKKFDSENKAAVSKLQHDQKILAAACKHSRERISQYEKELHKTLEMADSFKSKLSDVQNERDESIMLLKETNNELEGQIAKLKDDMQLLKDERDATLRALREAQIKLDEGKFSLENMESHIRSLEDRDTESLKKYEELMQAKTKQESSLLQAMTRKTELEDMVINLKTELELEKTSKDHLKKTLKEEADRKGKIEAERLHEYYNRKVQDILKAATEEASNAEAMLKDQIRRASIEAEKRLTECKERYLRELDILKNKYEAEIEKLKRENLQKQLLISSTVKQLQLCESANLDVSVKSTAVQPSRVSHNTTDLLEVFKTQSCQESTSDNLYKHSGVSNLTKFTLGHLPSIVPVSHPGGSFSKDNANGQHGSSDVAFETGKAFARYKTFTPSDSGQLSNAEANAGGDFQRNKGVGNQACYSDGLSRTGSEKVCNEKLLNSESIPDCTDFKNVLSHLLEVPVKPEKEQQIKGMLSTGKIAEPIDPALQKYIQELLKCYSDKLVDSSRNGVSASSSVVSVHVGVGNDNEQNDVNKNENESSSSCNSDSERTENNNPSNFSSQTASRSDSHKFSVKNEGAKSQQQSGGQGRPPWK